MVKRCPNGTRKNKKTGKCEPKQNKTRKTQQTYERPRKVCPHNKPLYNPKTNRCVLDNKANHKKIEKIRIVDNIREREEVRKVCNHNKPLYNPRTNRCVLDNKANRKKIEKITHDLHKEREKQLAIAKIKSPPSKKITKKNIQGPIYNVKNCNFSSFKNIDLNKLSITFEKDENRIKVFYKKGKQNIELNEKKLIGEGSYGKVYHYFNKPHNLNVALKTFSNTEDDEIKVLNAMERKNIDCNILACKILTATDPNYSSQQISTIACELYSSSLDNYELMNLLTIKDKILIIKQLANDLLCLEKEKLVYTDLKLENTLFKCLSKKKFKVTLGDIGSICMKENDGIATYVPWENRTYATEVECTDKQIVWGLGVMLLFMIYHSKNRKLTFLHWKRLERITKEEFKNKLVKFLLPLQNVDVSKKHDLNLASILHSMLLPDPKRRMSLKMLNAVLKNYE